MNRLLARLIASPWTIPALCLAAALALLVSLTTFVSYNAARDAEARERQYETCVETNRLRTMQLNSNEATEVLIRTILNVVLRPGQGSAERQLQVQDIYRDFRPAFDRYQAIADRLGALQDCRAIKETS